MVCGYAQTSAKDRRQGFIALATLCIMLGQVLSTRGFSGSATELPLGNLPAGTYLLTVQVEGQAPSVQRVVVE